MTKPFHSRPSLHSPPASRNILCLLCLLWSSQLAPTQATAETTHLFDGETLNGFKVIPADQAHLWRVEDGAITAGDQKTKVAKNSFLCTTTDFTNFEFTCEFKIAGDPKTGPINSGIQFRSYNKGDHVIGYQADIGDPGGVLEKAGMPGVSDGTRWLGAAGERTSVLEDVATTPPGSTGRAQKVELPVPQSEAAFNGSDLSETRRFRVFQDPAGWGCIYDEHRRNKILAASDMKKLAPALKRDGWNTYTIRCQGAEITLTINGVKTATYTEPDDNIARGGFIAPQIHSGGKAQVWFRKLTLSPISIASNSAPSEPELLALLNSNGVPDDKLIAALENLATIPSLAEDTFATLAADPNFSPEVRAAAVRTLAASKTPHSKKRIAALWPDLPTEIKPALKHLK